LLLAPGARHMLPLSQVHSIPMLFLGIVEIESIETGVHIKMYAHPGLDLANLQLTPVSPANFAIRRPRPALEQHSHSPSSAHGEHPPRIARQPLHRSHDERASRNHSCCCAIPSTPPTSPPVRLSPPQPAGLVEAESQSLDHNTELAKPRERQGQSAIERFATAALQQDQFRREQRRRPVV